MNVFALLRLFGKSWVAHQIASGLKHHLSPTGAAQMSADLSRASDALSKSDDDAAADALADIILAIH